MSSPQYRLPPTYEEKLIQSGNTSSAWYRFMQAMHLGIAPNQEVGITVKASPFTYIAPQGGFVIVNGGTVSKIQFTRTGTYTTGQTAGLFPVSLGDQIIVTYSGTPTMTFVSQ
jgi:hypothetical protein